ncbi:MAG: VOC family protein [Candidatus Dormibacteria bacterium]
MTNDSWRLGEVTLKVLDLDAQVDFYKHFGMRLLGRDGDIASLGAEGTPLLRLTRLVDGHRRPPRTAGLYHFALLLPSEANLGAFVRYAAAEHLPFVGAADHLVSEALYFEDPEGNHIEVYRDRPEADWTWSEGAVEMATLPLDLNRLAGLAGAKWEGFPPPTVLGHMHLNVGDLDRSQAFYETLGMTVMAEMGGFMRFMSWDNYHHHLGLNLAQGRGAAPVEPGVSGVESFTVRRVVTGPSDLTDPDGIRLVTEPVTVSSAL